MKKALKYMLLALSVISVGAVSGCCRTDGEDFTMTAVVDNMSDRIEVTVIEAPYGNTGPFWVITSEQTVFLGKDGEKIKREDIKPGDELEITWGGQVMMSYPPQIAALKIRIL
jgi:hypothetical protein